MKILVLASFPESILRFRGALLEEFSRKGFEVHVVAPGLLERPDICAELISKGYFPHEVMMSRKGLNPILDFACFLQILRLFFLLKPDYFFGYTIKPVVYGGLASWIARIPRRYAMVTGLGYAFKEKRKSILQRLLYSLVVFLYKLSLRKMEKVFFQNPDDCKLFYSLRILIDENSSVVVNGSGVDTDYYEFSPCPQGGGFLLIARLLGSKGVREYVKAARVIRNTYGEVRFFLAGWIDDGVDAVRLDELQEWIEDGVIEFLGRLDDVRPALRQCSVFVLPSYREGTPRTVLEAMSIGRPIITTNAPGCRETVRDGYNGFLVPVQDYNELADAMLHFIKRPCLMQEMGNHSRVIALEKYDVNKVNALMLEAMGVNLYASNDCKTPI